MSSITEQDSVPSPVLPYAAASESESSFDRYRKLAGIALTPLAFFAADLLTAGALKANGRMLAAILSAVAVLWVTETLPLPVTAVLGACLSIILGVADAKTVLAPFADPVVFLFIGSFMLAQAMAIHGLDRRIAIGFLSVRWIGAHPSRVLFGLGTITALISMWVSNTATAAMMLPIAIGILQAMNQARGNQSLRNWPLATGMMLMVAYAASIGGIGTPVGTPPNLIGVGLIRSLAHVEISFFRWMALACPLLLVMGAALFSMLYLLHPPRDHGATNGPALLEYLQQQRRKLGPWTAGQVNTLIAFGVAVLLWVFPGFLSIALSEKHPLAVFFRERLPESVIALIAAILLFVLPVKLREGRFTLSWEQAVDIDWGTILLFGGGLSLGSLMFNTGVAKVLGEHVSSLTGASTPWALTAAATAMAIFLSELTSNTAAANMIIPVVIAMAQAAGINPVPSALGACLGASYGFMLPVSTPPNAIVYGSGLVPIVKMVRAGVLFDVVGFFIILIGLRILCPLLGLA